MLFKNGYTENLIPKAKIFDGVRALVKQPPPRMLSYKSDELFQAEIRLKKQLALTTAL